MKLFFSACTLASLMLISGNAFAQTSSGISSHSAMAVSHHNCPNCRSGHVTTSGHGSAACDTCQFRLYPDAGYNPPVHMPVNQNFSTFRNYVPQQPYGHAGGGFIQQYPAVAQATDTAQLGYYYHQVPTWQSSSAKLPPRPVPGAFHNNYCPPQSRGGLMSHLFAGNTAAQPQPAAVQAAPQATAIVSTPAAAPQPVRRPTSAASATAGMARMSQVALNPPPQGSPVAAPTPVARPQVQTAPTTAVSMQKTAQPAAAPASNARPQESQRKNSFLRLPTFSSLRKR